MATFFLDIVSEDIPAHLQEWAEKAFDDYLTNVLQKSGLFVSEKTSLEIFTTPRRLAALVKNLPTKSIKAAEYKKGPWVDADPDIIKRFLKANNLKTVKTCQVIEEKGKKRLAIALPTQKLSDILMGIVAEIPLKFRWTEKGSRPVEEIKYKNLKTGQYIAYWVRPLKGVCAVLDKKPLEEFLAETYTNPALVKKPKIEITDAGKVLDILEKKAKVILSPERRYEKIIEEIKKEYPIDNNLLLPSLMEAVCKTEFPNVFKAKFSQSYLRELPAGLIESVVNSQECFWPNENKTDFLIISDSEPNEKIKEGFKNVIEAKFEDASYFIKRDLERALEDFLPLLKETTYHQQLGSIFQRAKRLEKLAAFVARELAPKNKEAHKLAAKAGLLAKADLATDTVKEFPYLQGTMGEYFLKKQQTGKKKDNELIAEAIGGHYKIMFHHKTKLLATDTAKVVDLSVRIANCVDYLTGLWLCGERATGSKDPLGIRNSAIDLFFSTRITGDNKRFENLLPQTLKEAWKLNYEALLKDDQSKKFTDKNIDEIINFIKERGNKYIIGAGIPPSNRSIPPRFIETLAVHKNLARCIYCLEVVFSFSKREGVKLAEIIEDASRVENIVRSVIENPPEFDEKKLQQLEERKLYEVFKVVDKIVAAQVENWQCYPIVFNVFKDFTQPLVEFFEKVTVNCDDPALRQNRLALLMKVRGCYRRIADFTKLRTG